MAVLSILYRPAHCLFHILLFTYWDRTYTLEKSWRFVFRRRTNMFFDVGKKNNCIFSLFRALVDFILYLILLFPYVFHYIRDSVFTYFWRFACMMTTHNMRSIFSKKGHWWPEEERTNLQHRGKAEGNFSNLLRTDVGGKSKSGMSCKLRKGVWQFPISSSFTTPIPPENCRKSFDWKFYSTITATKLTGELQRSTKYRRF